MHNEQLKKVLQTLQTQAKKLNADDNIKSVRKWLESKIRIFNNGLGVLRKKAVYLVDHTVKRSPLAGSRALFMALAAILTIGINIATGVSANQDQELPAFVVYLD